MLESVLNKFKNVRVSSCLSIVLIDAAKMFAAPRYLVMKQGIADRGIPRRFSNRQGQVMLAVRRFYSVANLPTTLLQLNIVEKHEAVHLINEIKITDPTEVSRLHDGDFHL